MARPDGRITAGDELGEAISARAWNRAQDAADIVLGRSIGGGPSFVSSAPFARVYLKNNSGAAIPRWGILKVSDAIPGITDPEFGSVPCIFGVTPTAGCEFVIATEPIANGAVGLCAISGVCPAKMVGPPGSRTAGVIEGDVTKLRAGNEGARVVFQKDDWGLVEIGASKGSAIRLGQFTGNWYNEPGISGADNVKLVKLYVQSPDASGATSANDWIPELDGSGDEVIAVTLNLFSYIPTRSGNDSSMWCAVMPLSDLAGEYWTGSYEYVEGGPDAPIMRPYSKLWLLLAAEC
ncbi:MAG: hypothetical protein WCI74_02025 [Actinomycetes bacterium]